MINLKDNEFELLLEFRIAQKIFKKNISDNQFLLNKSEIGQVKILSRIGTFFEILQ